MSLNCWTTRKSQYHVCHPFTRWMDLLGSTCISSNKMLHVFFNIRYQNEKIMWKRSSHLFTGVTIHALITKKQQNTWLYGSWVESIQVDLHNSNPMLFKGQLYIHANPEIRNASLERLISPFTRFEFSHCLEFTNNSCWSQFTHFTLTLLYRKLFLFK